MIQKPKLSNLHNRFRFKRNISLSISVDRQL